MNESISSVSKQDMAGGMGGTMISCSSRGRLCGPPLLRRDHHSRVLEADGYRVAMLA